MIRSVEGEFHESREGLCHGRRKQSRTFGKILEKRFVAKQTGHIGFSTSDKKELKISNDVLNDEITLEADTKLVEGALTIMKFIDAKGVDLH